MGNLTRRGFAGLSLGAFSTIAVPDHVFAAAQCVTGPSQQMPLPNRLAIDCASRQNFRLFRRYSDYVGLAGIVCMIGTRSASETYGAGRMLLYPWLKPKGRALRGAPIKAALPVGLTMTTPGQPIPGATLPQDGYLCSSVLDVRWQDFLGFTVDTPLGIDETRSGWCSNISKLADGAGVGVDWTSCNLNRAWFGGSNYIPNQAACNGAAWRALIADGLNQASVGAC